MTCSTPSPSLFSSAQTNLLREFWPDIKSIFRKHEPEKLKKLEEKMRKGQFTLDDFLDQLRQMKKLGSLESIVGMLPGGAQMLKEADLSKQEKEFRRMEGIICAMTLQERRSPQILNAKRRIRIATIADRG